MNSKRLNWHKNNIEQSSIKLEEYFSKADITDDNEMILYGILKGLILSMDFVLTEMHKDNKLMREMPKFMKMADKEPSESGNYIILVKDKKTEEQGLAMDYWWSGGWDDYGSCGERYEVIAYTRCFEERR